MNRLIANVALATAVVASALVAFQMPDAKASLVTTFDWSYSGFITGDAGYVNGSLPGSFGAVSGSGSLTATDQGAGEYLVDTISGTANGLAITGLSNYAAPDGFIFTNYPQVDFFGLAFTVAGGDTFNIYSVIPSFGTLGVYDCGITGYCLIGPGTASDPSGTAAPDQEASVSFSLTQTPLPSTWLMLLSGFVGLGFFAYRGTKKNSAAFAAA